MPQDDTAVTTPNSTFARPPPPAELLAGRYRLGRCVGTGGNYFPPKADETTDKTTAR